MSSSDLSQKLAAILAADVAGYSRLMSGDERGTVAALDAARAVFKAEIESKRGRVIDMAGDSILAIFESATGAVSAALAIQDQLASRLGEVPEQRRMRFRIGIHLGDVIEKPDGSVYGDGVNIAARLEGLAAPGGVTVSDSIRNAVRGKVGGTFEDQGEQTVKNISEPVRAYAVRPTAAPEVSGPNVTPVHSARPPDKPSIAVLPFDNMSGDPEQEYFADGMTEDLITDLSKVSGLFVVARTSTFAYKNKRATDIRAIARHLGVRYVLEGSVRKSGDRVRINVQLIDSDGGGHLWAERYDGTIANVFELQDEVGAKVVSALSVRLESAEQAPFSRVHTRNLEAYELFVRARATPYPPVPERIAMAREMFERVITMDSTFAGGYAGVALMLGFESLWAHRDMSEAITRAADLARKAIDIDDSLALPHMSHGLALVQQGRYDDAIAAFREAVARQPNDADAHAYLGLGTGLSGEFDEAVEALEHALRLNPQFVNGPYLNMLGSTQLLHADYAAAVQCFERNRAQQGPWGPPAYCWSAAALWAMGRRDEATAISAELRRKFPAYRLQGWNYLSTIRHAEIRDRTRSLMRDAGVPEIVAEHL